MDEPGLEEKMKTAVYYNNSDVRIEDQPKPEISTNEILVKMSSAGICGSDVLEWYRVKTAPRVLGHEITGIIEEVGANVSKYQKGQRVFVSHHVPCENCHYCKFGNETACKTLHTTNYHPGGFSEYIQVPEQNVKNGVFVLPDEISDNEGTLIEPLACTVRAQRIAGMQTGKSVLVIGSGVAGLLHVKLAKSNGASKVFATDINDFRLQKAKEFGADEAFNANDFTLEKLKQANNNLLADIVILCTAAESAVAQAVDSIEKGGTLMFFAVPDPDKKIEFPMSKFWRDSITLTTSYAGAPKDIAEAIELIKSKKVVVSDLITHELALEKAQEGFELVAKAQDSLKVILKA
jgi:L-iditol 2-dehydrogenase|tara:strand:- start:179 stop:1225 length:1047 start_codon:yes stop_codon:yes gene_type:complete